MSSRINEVDVAKGIGILLVILGHILPEGTYFRTIIYSFHMPLFFILSGLLVNKSKIINQENAVSLKNLIRNNSKLIACYMFYSVLYMLFDMVYRVIMGKYTIGLIIWDSIETLTLFGINVLWFITAIIIAKEIGIQILDRIQARSGLFACSVTLFVIINFLSRYIAWPEYGYKRIIYYIVVALLRGVVGCSFWLFGYCFKDYLVRIRNNGKTVRLIMISIAATAIIMACGYLMYLNGEKIDVHLLKFPHWGVLYITSIIGTVGVLAISRLVVMGTNALQQSLLFFGKNSLLIMVTHEYLQIRHLARGFIALICKIVPILDNADYWAEFVVVCIFEVVICYLFGSLDRRSTKYFQSKLLLFVK